MKESRIGEIKNLSLVAIIMAAITLAACSGNEDIIGGQPATGTFTFSVNASKGDDAITRALTLDGTTINATWTAGDAVTVYNVTRSAELTGTLTAQSNGATTTLGGSLTGTIVNGDVLKLKFLSPTYTSQDGTLATIATTCDYAEATVTVTDVSTSPVTTTAATFANQQAIVKFTLKDKGTDAAINATKLTVNAGGTVINVTPASATDVLYVAIPGISSQTVSLSATAGSTGYTYEKSGVTLANGHYYGFTVSMDEAPLATSEPLTFEAKEAGATVTFTAGTSVTNPIEYSTDGTTWTTYSAPITLANVGDKVSFRGDNAAYGASSSSDCSKFFCPKGCYIYGNIMSLINSTGYATATELTGDYTFACLFHGFTQIYNYPSKPLVLPATTLAEGCYNRMFYGCTNLATAPELPSTALVESCYYQMFALCNSLTTAPELPATTLAKDCYSSMFWGCNLTTAPELPAMTLAEGCYNGMFSYCSSLTTTPELPVTTLAARCYSGMFFGCTSLTTAPELPATTLAEGCYNGMFSYCSSLTTAPELPATTLNTNCYSYMFEGCTSLTTAPDLSATTLAGYCCNAMFKNCTSLATAPELPATTLVGMCYQDMFEGCTSLTTAPNLPATTLAIHCYDSMFKDCTSLTIAPDLPATTLADYCYIYMFKDCTSLNSVKCLATDISASGCTDDWLDGVATTGAFTKASSMTSWTTGADGIPSGWTVQDE